MQENVTAKGEMENLGMFDINQGHDSVLNPNKGKIFAVFCFSSQYKGASINEKLLSEPDLTNQVVKVLIRIKIGRVAFMASIQAMFYHQVKVPKKQRSFLRFF